MFKTAEVTSVGSPVEVRLYGDTADTPCPLGNPDLTLSTNDKVLVAQVGGAWVVVCVLEAT